MTEREMKVNVKPGGTMEVQVGDSQESPMQRRSMGGPGIFHNEGTMEYNVGSGKTIIHGTQEVHANNRSGVDTGTIMSTVRKPTGSPISSHSEINDDCLVTVRGATCTVGVAKRNGWVTQDAQGNYFDSRNQQPEQSPQQQTQQQRNDNPPPIADRTIARLIEQGRSQHGEYFDAMVAKAVGRIVAGKEGTQTATEFATEVGLDNAKEGADALNSIIHGVQNRAYDMVEHYYKIPAGEVSDFLNNQMTPEAKAQTIIRLYHGDASAIRDLAERIRLKNRF